MLCLRWADNTEGICNNFVIFTTNPTQMKHTISSVFMLSFAMLLFSGCKKKDKDQPQQSTTAPVLIPMVVTAAITGITDSTAVSGGTVTSEGASAITAVGICWDTMPS